MSTQQSFVIIGAGLAGTRAAQTLRAEGFDGRVTLVGDEAERPYDRVTLSKHFLYREPGFHGLFLHDDAFYADQGITLMVDTAVSAIDAGRGDVVLASGKRLRYDRLLLTTGSAPRRWTGRGADLTGVHYLRTLADARALRDDLERVATAGGTVVVVGDGFIGLEVAAAARQVGAAVELIGRGAVPLARQVGAQLGGFFAELQASRGVVVHPGCELAAIGGAGRVEEVVLTDGSVVPADLVVIGIGATARTHLAATAGAEATEAGGIVTDETFRTTTPNLFAAGDCARVPNAAIGRSDRPGHFSAAFVQGPAAARAMLGTGRPYRQVPFFFSDQFDMWMEFTGDRQADDRLVVRTYTEPETFIAFWLRGGRLVAGMNINIKGVQPDIATLIGSGDEVDEAALVDPAVPLPQCASRA